MDIQGTLHITPSINFDNILKRIISERLQHLIRFISEAQCVSVFIVFGQVIERIREFSILINFENHHI